MAKFRKAKKFVVKGINLTSVFKQDYIENDADLRSQLARTRKATSKLEKIRRKMEDTMKDLESDDKLGNFEIQGLMSDFNETQMLVAKISDRLDGLINSFICKAQE
ncbi:MAG: hypothetical protein V4628_11865 [Pseudomonadota bacterium]